MGGVVQFCYGDDGLDPACLEGDAQPTEFVRAWRHASVCFSVASFLTIYSLCLPQSIASRSGRALLPFEIMEITDRELSKPKFKNECADSYTGTIRNFIMDRIAHRLAKIRQAHGLFDALEKEEEWDEETDFSMGASRTPCVQRLMDMILKLMMS